MTVDAAALARDERADLLGTVRALTPEQWSAPSLCAGWSVRDVVAHVLSYDELGVPGLVATFVRGGLRFDPVNAVALRRYRDHTPADLVALLEAHLEPRGLTAALGGRIGLTDGLVHHQDVRRGLGLPPRTIPAERLREALGVASSAPTLPSRRLRRGLRLVAEDVGWSLGEGPEVRGPGEAVLLAMAGRSATLDELSGPGAPTLARRVRG
ncbi:maleylpyruvate isomerase family mycothiol-dependent enzyme [Phycicoccus flavus]|uniref:maleylpyruvate isomerase family mycothiol-dependent enzyme n=1 Tax=Phycicoccus flavus TaxID=2502783 RepID=UPI000FEB68F4|nr:maleylpyruvate isomerase family mycothiol-dependent enzyme [Phycicoccus flavus]NHA70149.1 maleylpyruvate isomerase family mycothiol-dependent enzyme [Phycicoccus flavus]